MNSIQNQPNPTPQSPNFQAPPGRAALIAKIIAEINKAAPLIPLPRPLPPPGEICILLKNCIAKLDADFAIAKKPDENAEIVFNTNRNFFSEALACLETALQGLPPNFPLPVEELKKLPEFRADFAEPPQPKPSVPKTVSGSIRAQTSFNDPISNSNGPATIGNRAHLRLPFDDDDLNLAFLELERRRRGGRPSPLDHLTPQQEDQLFHLLKDHSAYYVARLIGQPGPIGWDVVTSRSALDRFRHNYPIRLARRAKAARLRNAVKVMASENPDAAFREKLQRNLQARLLAADLDDPTGRAAFTQLANSFAKLQRATAPPK